MAHDDIRSLRDKAWIGDAVLALYAREWILKQPGLSLEQRTEIFIQMTSNQFLSCFGEPTSVEAQIGSLYHTHGLEHAFEYLDQTLLPLFRKQIQNRRRGQQGRR